ncbi:hypothetical protein BASA50_009685 [Batrachochytrium salamandrivorans]|uniref:RING-type domain-containing protein n=1 Tax=Batrachochytrium salamandrivorans TaxID=1357716 RepID=A0ABQ8F138_9FUNG|nr:hypothetical protein BASA50_009685 [Batrachochytrium salamandrivorans]
MHSAAHISLEAGASRSIGAASAGSSVNAESVDRTDPAVDAMTARPKHSSTAGLGVGPSNPSTKASINAHPNVSTTTTTLVSGPALLTTLQSDLRAVCSPLPASEQGEDLSALSTCRICLDVINEAYMTSCGHSFCFICIQQQLAIKPQCPACSNPVDDGQVYPNFTLNRMITKTHQRRGTSPAIISQSSDLNTHDIDAMVSKLLAQKRRIEVVDRSVRLELLGDFLRKTIEEKKHTLAELSTQLRYLNEDMSIVDRLVAPVRDDTDADFSDLDLPVPHQRDQAHDRNEQAGARSPKGGNNAQVPDAPYLILHSAPAPQEMGSSEMGPSEMGLGGSSLSATNSMGGPSISITTIPRTTINTPRGNTPIHTRIPLPTVVGEDSEYGPEREALHAHLLAEAGSTVIEASNTVESAPDTTLNQPHNRVMQGYWRRKRHHSLIEGSTLDTDVSNRNLDMHPPPILREPPKPTSIRLINGESLPQRIPRLKVHIEDLQSVYFEWRLGARPSNTDHDDLPDDLARFSSSLAKFSKYSRFRTLATARYGEIVVTSQLSIVSSIDFDKDDEFFAAAGVSKKIKIFEYSSVVVDARQLAGYTGGFISRSSRLMRANKRGRSERQRSDMDVSASVGGSGESFYGESQGNASLDQVAVDEEPDTALDESNRAPRPENVPRYPTREMSSRSKISCLSYNSYIKPYLLSSDYEGVVTLWDASVGTAILTLDEHEKRTWSVDFSVTDPMRIASGSDDTRVKLWQANQKRSVLTIESKANICSVKFHPNFSHHLAFGSADHHVHYYDLRNPTIPLHVFKGHRKAVSYVKFINDNEMVSASTDCSLRLWSLKESMTGSAMNAKGRSQSVFARSYNGHTNEKNFVGLSVNCDGEFIACGSETNEVYTYFSKLSKPVLTHHFGSTIDSVTGAPNSHADPSLFVSSMCWKRKTPNILVAANSQGRVKVLEMV